MTIDSGRSLAQPGAAVPGKIPTECISWRWHGNLGDDMIFAAQEALFQDSLALGQYIDSPKAVLVGGGTFVPKALEHPDLVALSRRHPTAFFGTGIGDPIFWGTTHIPDWLEVMRNSNFIGVRGPLSKERLEEWGVPAGRVEWIGDPALYFAQPTGARQFGFNLAVNLGITYNRLYGFDEGRLEEIVICALQDLVRAGWNITLVCAWGADDVVVERIAARVAVRSVEHWHENYQRALDSVGQFDVVLCEKLHVGVVAACRGVPFVALKYRSKVLDFCRSIGWEDFCVGIEDLTPDRLSALVNSLIETRDQNSMRLQKSISETRARLLAAVPRTEAALAVAAT
jgi:polysaccharide pyruvyl transferase WcaK-like protein